MSTTPSPDDGISVWLSDETVVVYLTVIARAVRQLDRVYGSSASARFLAALEQSLALETDLSKVDSDGEGLLSGIHGVLVRLVRTMPDNEDIP